MKISCVLILILLAAGMLGAQQEITLLFAGDLMAHDVNARMEDYSLIYAEISDFLDEADFAFANLEFPVDDSKPLASFPLFNLHSDYVEAAVQAGFDVFSLANNHTCDQGEEGVAATRDAMAALSDEYDIFTSGLRSAPGESPRLTKIPLPDGGTLGFLAVAGFSNVSEGSRLMYRYSCRDEKAREELTELVRQFRKECSLLVISVHDGVEYRRYPSPEKESFMHALAEAGADIVWGHHPHVLQPWYMTEKDAVIIFSAGNLISGQTWMLHPGSDPAHWWSATGDGALYRLVYRNGAEGWQLAEAGAIPVSHLNDRKEDRVVVVPARELQFPEHSGAWSPFFRTRYRFVQPYLPLRRMEDQPPAAD